MSGQPPRSPGHSSQENETRAIGSPERRPSVPLFQPGTLLSERYRVVRFLAQGGMGEVYEAEDMQLHEHVALKTICVGVLLALLAVVAILKLRTARRTEETPVVGAGLPTAPMAPRRTVAVLGFKSLSGRPGDAWLSTAFAQMLNTELGAGEKLRTIPAENVSRMRLELGLGDSDVSFESFLRSLKRRGRL